MTARTGMADLIAQLRVMCCAGTADFTQGTVTYWTDDQLQAALDKYRTPYKMVEIDPSGDYISGAYSYTEYPLPGWLTHLEGTATGWALRTAAGGTVPAYTANLDAGLITFTADTGGTSFFLDCRSYDIYRAAADVWNEKAAAVAALAVDWRSDNHQFSDSQEYDHCLKMAEQFSRRAGMRVSLMQRTDEA